MAITTGRSPNPDVPGQLQPGASAVRRAACLFLPALAFDGRGHCRGAGRWLGPLRDWARRSLGPSESGPRGDVATCAAWPELCGPGPGESGPN